jgi:uncharacterized protein YigE (DUF2233 family)
LRIPVLLALLLAGHAALAVECDRFHIDAKAALACRVDVPRERLKLYLEDGSGRPLKTFAALQRLLASQDQKLVFAMNAGMFHQDYSPVGLFIADGKQTASLNAAAGQGNFFLKPNGVFLVSDRAARIVESSQFNSVQGEVSLATQSGPLLVQQGKIHARFSATSSSRLIRNGVGVDRAGVAVFAITEAPMSFHEFARLFRDVLHCADALYFDGVVSSVKLPAEQPIQRANLGPIIAVVE